MKIRDLVGLTVVKAKHIDNDAKGVVLVFDDGSTLEILERMQAGQLMVCLNDEYCGEGDGNE
jgi:hypothetical protein